MRLLLPPSETKRPGGRGRSLRTRTATHPLDASRAGALDALAELLAHDDRAAAMQALLLPPAAADAALRANAAVRDAPTMPAIRRYAGTVYQGLAYDELTRAEQHVAVRTTLIFSGLFGVLRGDEPVPDYRVPAKAVLPGIGTAATYWRPRLAAPLAGTVRDELVVDLRSGDYAAMWRPTGRAREHVVAIRILSPVPRGGLGVVSFTSKLAKGRLAAELVRRQAAGELPRDHHDVVAAWMSCGGVDAVTTATGLDLHTG
ncbi:peroxide stress protein YaaA [uncultured Jatrophihabitans sp.]|uniref:peroxide stress protein YaaA n=1 Tax=uncultured Jatrophihabitans sp. TaxID=1610747 RepID=UPI0035CA0794